MIFAPDMIALIRERRKSQTRRDWPVCRVRVGRKYTVQPGRGQRGVLDITILDVRRERLGDITSQDVRREGFRFRAEFEQRWAQLHGAWTPDREVWVISFAAGDLRDHFDQPRLLARSPGRAGEAAVEHQDYVTEPRLAMLGEPEAVPAAYQEKLSTGARVRDSVRKRAQRAEQPTAMRVQELERRAKEGDRQAQRHLFMINKHLGDADRRRSREVA